MQLYKTCEQGYRQPAESTVRLLLRDIVTRIGNIFIILDAPDECTDREPLLAFFKSWVKGNWQGVHLIVTSRHEKDIEDQLSAIANHTIGIKSTMVDKDIHTYVDDRLATDPMISKWPPAVRDEIFTVLMKKADGM